MRERGREGRRCVSGEILLVWIVNGGGEKAQHIYSRESVTGNRYTVYSERDIERESYASS